MKTPLFLLFTLLSTLQIGCVTGRRTLPLAIPSQPPGQSLRGDVSVSSVVDRRVFQNHPPEAYMPSVDGDVNALSAAQKASMIGRQRNGFGHALGDISLPAGESVAQRAKLLVEEALKHRGYRVTSSSGAASASVEVNEFWAWMSPGAFAAGFKAKLNCTVTLRKGGRSTVLVVAGNGLNYGQVAKNENWREAYEIAMRDFLANFDAAAERAGF